MRTQAIVLALAIVLLCPFTSAQWVKTNGPYGGSVYCFAVSGTNLFAGTWGGGVFLSTDSGASWTPVNNGLTDSLVLSLAMSGTNLFAGTYGGGVFVSTNNGTSWTAAGPRLTSTYVYALALSGTSLFAGTDHGVFLSTNGGTSWTPVNSGLWNSNVLSFAVSDSNIIAGTSLPGGIYRSTDNGTSWTSVINPFNNYIWPGDFYSYAVAISGANMFAETESPGWLGYWYNRVYRSTDNGTYWTEVGTGLPTRSSWVSSFVVSSTNMFAGTNGNGVFLSTNNGTSWAAVNTDLMDTSVWSLTVSGTNLFAGTYYGGVYRRPLSEMITGVDISSTELPGMFKLEQNYPNPFNPSTTIKFELPRASHVSLAVYDVLGRQVSVLVNERRDAGVHEVKFDASGLSSGVYFYRLQAGTYVETRKLLLLR